MVKILLFVASVHEWSGYTFGGTTLVGGYVATVRVTSQQQ